MLLERDRLQAELVHGDVAERLAALARGSVRDADEMYRPALTRGACGVWAGVLEAVVCASWGAWE